MKRTPLARMSKRRKRESEEYMKLRKQFLEDNPLCMVWCLIMDGPGTPGNKIDDLTLACIRAGIPSIPPDSVEIHHRCCGKNRKASYLRTDTWMAVSKWGHRFIHDNPKLAYERGWLLKQIPPIPT